MTLAVGSRTDATLLNATVMEVSPDGLWYRVRMSVGADGNAPSVWLPVDERVTYAPIQPSSWPPAELDIWIADASQTVAWVVASAGILYFVTEANIKNKTIPVTTDAALAMFGNAMTLLYRK